MITKFQRINLEKLLKFLKSLPADYDKLDMSMWAENDEEAAYATPENPCRSRASLVCYGPSAGIPLPKRSFYKDGSANWSEYASKAFPSKDGDFLFGSSLSTSVPERIARIEMVLAGNVPDDWDDWDDWDD